MFLWERYKDRFVGGNRASDAETVKMRDADFLLPVWRFCELTVPDFLPFGGGFFVRLV